MNDPSQFDAAATYDSAFFTEVEFENRTSLITDPPTGRLPAYTLEGQRRRDAKSGEPETVEDLPIATRCIAFGMPRIAGVAGTPSAGIYAYYQIVQTSEYVVFFPTLLAAGDDAPRADTGYRCAVCRLELMLDTATNLMVIAPIPSRNDTPPTKKR